MNQLEVRFRTRTIVVAQPGAIQDRRYRLLVTLIRADRPRYWNFLCHNCGSKVCEIMNEEVIGIDDFYDPQNPNNHGISKHCKGTLPDGLPCPYTYVFQLGQ